MTTPVGTPTLIWTWTPDEDARAPGEKQGIALLLPPGSGFLEQIEPALPVVPDVLDHLLHYPHK